MMIYFLIIHGLTPRGIVLFSPNVFEAVFPIAAFTGEKVAASFIGYLEAAVQMRRNRRRVFLIDAGTEAKAAAFFQFPDNAFYKLCGISPPSVIGMRDDVYDIVVRFADNRLKHALYSWNGFDSDSQLLNLILC